MAFVIYEMDFGTTLSEMGDRKKVRMDLGTMKNILDNSMLISRIIMNINFNLTLADSMKDMFVAKENGMWRIKG